MNQDTKALTEKWVDTQRAIERAGPPTPRSQPYRRPTHAEGALTFGHGDHPEAYDERSKSWAAFRTRMLMYWTPMIEGAERDGFFAGWQARTEFDRTRMRPIDKPVEVVSSLFPTEAEVNNGKTP